MMFDKVCSTVIQPFLNIDGDISGLKDLKLEDLSM